MNLRIYEYKNCDTCRSALKFLKAHGVPFTTVPIREQPPSEAELKRMLGQVGGQLRRLFNTSGQDYKALKLKDRLSGMTETEALALLSKNGNLVKRPFAVWDGGSLIGFREEEWRILTK